MFDTPKEKGGIYPAFLSCCRTSTNTEMVTFCGITIESGKENFILCVYDKKKDFPFAVVNYPHVDSNIPEAIVYSAYLGQLFRFWNICNREQAFIDETTSLTVTLMYKNGCERKKLLSRFFLFMSRTRPKYRMRNSRLIRLFEKQLTIKESMKDRTVSYTIVYPDIMEKEHQTDKPFKEEKKKEKRRKRKGSLSVLVTGVIVFFLTVRDHTSG